MEEQRLVYSILEFANLTRTSPGFIRKQIRIGTLSAAKCGSRVLIPVQSAHDWLRSRMRAAAQLPRERAETE